MTDINLCVVDLYHDDRVSDFGQAASAGIWGIIHKASTGATGRDPAYADRRQQAIDAGLLWGAYHWGTNAPVPKQVDNFLSAATPDDQTLVALDFEETSGNQMTIDQVRQFLQLLADSLGRMPVLYCGGLLKQQLGKARDPFFGSHRLWLAQYSSPPVVQASWVGFWLWQYTEGKAGLQPNQVPGIPGDTQGNVDCNSFNGTQDDLAASWV